MKRLPNIDLSYNTAQQLLENPYTGGEAILCRYKDTLLKLFTYDGPHIFDNFFSREEYPISNINKLVGMSDNKLKKILALYQLQLDFCTNPIATVTIDGELVGFQMVRDKADFSLRSSSITSNTYPYVLRITQEILEYFNEYTDRSN